MAYVRTTEVLETSRCGANDKGVVSGERVFRVEYNSLVSGGIDAIKRITVQRFDPFVDPTGEVEPRCLADEVDASREDPASSFNWIVTVKYSSKLWDETDRRLASGGIGTTGRPPNSQTGGGPQDQNSPANPMAMPWVLSVESSDSDTELLTVDADGRAVVNSAGDPFDPPITRPIAVTTLVIDQAVPVPDATTQAAWDGIQNCVNRQEFFNRPRGRVLCKSVNWRTEQENGFMFARRICIFQTKKFAPTFWPNSTPIEGGEAFGDWDTWQAIVPDRGAFEIDTTTGKRREIFLPGGFGGQVWNQHLDGSGHQLSTAAISAGNFKYHRYKKYQEADFAFVLNLYG